MVLKQKKREGEEMIRKKGEILSSFAVIISQSRREERR
jgi:hypothetical protein